MSTFRPGDRVHMWQNAWLASTTGTVTGTTPEGRTLVRWDDNQAVTSHLPQHLEPAGEPMSKKPNQFTNESGSKFMIASDLCGHIGLGVETGGNAEVMRLPATEAPTIALTILEAAGWPEADPNSITRGILCDLKFAVEVEANKAKEAADREALETEALHLCRIMWDNPDQAWTPMSPDAKAKWLKMARTARTLHGVTK